MLQTYYTTDYYAKNPYSSETICYSEKSKSKSNESLQVKLLANNLYKIITQYDIGNNWLIIDYNRNHYGNIQEHLNIQGSDNWLIKDYAKDF